jgi:hypothetical protein
LICAGGYYYFFAGEQGLLGGEGYDEAQEDFAAMRPADTVWTPDMNARKTSTSAAKKK